MIKICFYFQVHQPYRIRKYSFFDINNSNHYFDDTKNRDVLTKVANKCYMPTNAILLDLLKKHPEFKISFSFSGVLLDQLEQYCPQALNSFQKLVETGQVELLSETYHHSLSFLYSRDEFEKQVNAHKTKIKQVFKVTPTVFRNTELIYNNDLAHFVSQMGYKAILAEGADKTLGWRSPNFVYRPAGSDISLLLKNYRLSDDIAFRFSEKGWSEYPLTTDKFCKWLNNTHGNGEIVNIFMDYETFGEHQWEDTGIFEFLKHLPGELLKHPDNAFRFPSEIAEECSPVAELDIPHFVSWADVERDTSAWLGNDMQRYAIEKIYSLEEKVNKSENENIMSDWSKLQTSDHFYYMCTKWFNDGDVHKYFNPYDSPYDAFIYFMNVCKNLENRINENRINREC